MHTWRSRRYAWICVGWLTACIGCDQAAQGPSGGTSSKKVAARDPATRQPRDVTPPSASKSSRSSARPKDPARDKTSQDRNAKKSKPRAGLDKTSEKKIEPPQAPDQAPEQPHEDAAPQAKPEEEATSPDSTSADQEAPSSRDDSRARLILFTPQGPILVELIMTIDKLPYRQTRERLVADLLRSADTNQDGKTTWAEVLDKPPSVLAPAVKTLMEGRDRKEFLMAYDLNRDGKLDTDEARRLVAQVDDAGSAFSVEGSTDNRDYNQHQSLVRLLLDQDHDGLLNHDELGQAALRIMARDANGDEIVDLAELRDNDAEDPDNVNASIGESTPRAAMQVFPLHNFESIYYELVEFYSKGDKIRPASFMLAPALYQALDVDEDQVLSRREVERLDEVPPQLVLEVHFGRSSDPATGLAILEVDPALGPPSAARHPRQIFFRLAEMRLRFTLDDFAAETPTPEESAKAVLAQLDADKNGYLEKKELPTGVLADFSQLDLDKDDKVFEKELLAFVERQQAPALSGVHALGNDDEDALFTAIDADSDSRLGPRELLRAAETLQRLDTDGDGQIAIAEIPASIGVSIQRARPAMRNPMVPIEMAPAPSVVRDGPAWFVRMDLNGDQDLSSREFLGTTEQFSALDHDGDGFIDVQEAKAGDQAAKQTTAVEVPVAPDGDNVNQNGATDSPDAKPPGSDP